MSTPACSAPVWGHRSNYSRQQCPSPACNGGRPTMRQAALAALPPRILTRLDAYVPEQGFFEPEDEESAELERDLFKRGLTPFGYEVWSHPGQDGRHVSEGVQVYDFPHNDYLAVYVGSALSVRAPREVDGRKVSVGRLIDGNRLSLGARSVDTYPQENWSLRPRPAEPVAEPAIDAESPEFQSYYDKNYEWLADRCDPEPGEDWDKHMLETAKFYFAEEQSEIS